MGIIHGIERRIEKCKLCLCSIRNLNKTVTKVIFKKIYDIWDIFPSCIVWMTNFQENLTKIEFSQHSMNYMESVYFKK